MQILRSVRTVVSYSTAALLALNIFGGIIGGSTVHAAGTSLTVSEINWAGSPKAPTDTWLEIENKAGLYAATVADPLTFCAAGTAVFSLTTGTIAQGSYLLVRNSLATVTTLSANEVASAVPVDLSLLPKVSTDLQLVIGTCAAPTTVLDSITAQGTTPAPFKGQNGSAGIFSSMERVAANGNLATSWIDSASHKTVGKNLDPATLGQYATPSEAPILFGAPTNVALTPRGSSVDLTSVTLTGKADPNTVAIEVASTAHGVVGAKPQILASAIPVTLSATNTFTVTTTVPTTTDGVYDFSVRGLNGPDSTFSDRSALNPISAELMGGSTYVVYASASALPAPVLTGPTPVFTQATTYALSGTTTGATSVIVLSNGEYATAVTPDAVTGAFTVNIPLTPNSKNTLSAVAENGAVFSTISTNLVIWQDSTAPAAITAAKVAAQFGTNGVVTSVTGQDGAVTVNPNDGALTVFMYADAAKTHLLAGPVAVTATGSFPQIVLTASQYATVYLTVKDQAGNESAVTSITNPAVVLGGTIPLNPSVISVQQTSVTIGWTPVTGAQYYLIKYKTDGGTYSQAMAQCQGVTTCSDQVVIQALNPGTAYVFAIAAVDTYGNVTAFSELPFTTLQPTPVITTVVSTTAPLTPPPATPAPVKRSTDSVKKVTTPTPSPTVAPATPTPSASPETGDVKSSSTDASHNWTPWIILGILLALAVLATAGYFYWFGGEAGAAAVASAEAAKERVDAVAAEKKATPPAKPAAKDKPKDKRW